LLENDLIMTRFLDAYEQSLSDGEVAALSSLLELPDNDLMDLILARAQIDQAIDSPDVRRVVVLLQTA
jgi:antitoxin CptB